MPNKVDIPDNNESLHDIGAYIMQYQPLQNAFVTALVNRIGRVLVTSKMWDNPYAVFKRGTMDFGETVEEIFVNIAKPHSFDPATAETEVFKREMPDVRAAFHTMNYQKFYKVTVQNDQLRQAFLSYSGLTDLIAKIVESLSTSMQLDEFLTMKYMLCREALNGGMYVVNTADVATNPKDAVTKFRQYTNNLKFLKTIYNRARVRTSTPVDRQIIFVPNDAEATIGVEVLADAFNLSQVDYLGKRIAIDSFDFDTDDTARLAELFANDTTYTPFTEDEITALQAIVAVKVDREWWMVFDNFQQMTENYNGQGLYWQYFMHTWKTFSVSPYANAIVFTSQTPAITGVTVSPNEVNVSKNQSAQFTAAVAGTGLIDKSVLWSITGQNSSTTQINPNSGVLFIGPDEESNTEITVKATAVDGTSGTATATVA